MEIIPLTNDLEKEWDTIAIVSPDAWFYHLYDEQRLLDKAWHAISHSFLIEDNKQIVGICSLQEHMGNPFLFDSTILGPAGIALIPGLDFDKRNEYFEFAYKHIKNLFPVYNRKACRINIPPLSENSLKSWSIGVHPLLQFGFQDCSTKTAIIDLRNKSADDIFKSLRRNHKRNIRKCRDLDMSIKFGDTIDDVKEYYKLHKKTYERTGVTPHPFSYFEAIHRFFTKKDKAFMIMLFHEDRLLSVANFAYFRNKVLYWTAANEAEASKYGAQKYLLWKGIEHAKDTLKADYIEVGEMFDNPEGKLKGLTQLKSGWGDTHPFWKGLLFGS